VNRFQFSPLSWALALGADFGGNGTLIDPVLALLQQDYLRFSYRISLNRWFRIEFPSMLATLAIGTVSIANM
jgi:Na+/H+ antiporter NhaD/arsenite permease-like protein